MKFPLHHVIRTFRKDPQTHHGYVTLAIMEKLFKKHGSPLPPDCAEQLRSNYAIDAATAAPILKVHRTLLVGSMLDYHYVKLLPPPM